MCPDYRCFCTGRIVAGKITWVDVLDYICIPLGANISAGLWYCACNLALVECWLQYALGLVGCVLVELLQEPSIARVYGALFSYRLLFIYLLSISLHLITHTRYVRKVSDLRLDNFFRLWGCCALRICSKRSDDQQRILRWSSKKIAWCREKKTTAFLVNRWLASSPR